MKWQIGNSKGNIKGQMCNATEIDLLAIISFPSKAIIFEFFQLKIELSRDIMLLSSRKLRICLK